MRGGIEFFCKPFAAETGLRRVKRSTDAFVREAAGATKPKLPVSDAQLWYAFFKKKITIRAVPDASRQSTARQHLSHLRSINAVQLGGGEDGT